jgi:sugar phosphate isomerase/epimerase
MLTLRSVDAEVKLCQEREDLFSTFCQGLDHAKAFCAADLKAVLDTAHLMAVHEIIVSKSFAQEKHHVVLGKQHIKDAFRRTRPSLLPADKLMFKRSFQSFLTHDLKVDGSEWYDGSLTSDSGTAYSDIKLKTSLR